MISVDKLCVPLKIRHTLNDLPPTCQWASVLRVSCKDSEAGQAVMGLTLPTAALFAGPPGNGRHLTAHALAGSLCNKYQRYIGCFQIHGSDLELADQKDLTDLMHYIRKLTEQGPIILLLDQPELSEHGKDLQRRLLRFQGAGLFLIVITEDAKNLIPEALSRCPLYPCPPPNAHQVYKWVEQITKKPVAIKIAAMSTQQLAKTLTGLSWRQLTDFHTHLLRLMILSHSRNRKMFEEKGLSEKAVLTNGYITLQLEDVSPILSSLESLKPQAVTVPAVTAAAPAAVAAAVEEAAQPVTNTDGTDAPTGIQEQLYSDAIKDEGFWNPLAP